MPKKIITISIVVILIIGLAMVVYYFISNNNTNKTTSNTDNQTSDYPDFNPFGTGTKIPLNNINTNNNNDTNTTQETLVETPTSKLHKITDFAIAGAGFFEDTRPLPEEVTATPTETLQVETKTATNTKKVVTPKVILPKVEIVPSIRYVERATGHIYQMYLDNKKTGKVSNSTVPAIYEAIFDGKAKSVMYRYISTNDQSITTFLATLGGNSSFLPSNILTTSLSPDKSKFFYLTKNNNGVIGTIGSFEESKKTQVFSSSFSEWLPQWVSEKSIFLTTKPSYLVNGSLFSMNINNGSLTKVFGGIPGLTTLVNNKGLVVLYNISTETGPELGIFNITDRKTKDVNIYGLPEKCVWSVDSITAYCAIPQEIKGFQYPDIWYQGLVSFDDNFIKINTATGGITILNESASVDPVDATNLFLSKDEGILFFTNKKDSTLWSLDLK